MSLKCPSIKATCRQTAARVATVLCAALTASLLLPAAVSAQTLRDPALAAAFAEERHDDLRRMATERRRASPDDAEALMALTLLALEAEDRTARRALLADARACSQRRPEAQPCVYVMGLLDGLDAAEQGMFAMARRAGSVREALTRAHELDPTWYPGRTALLEFHAIAPGVMGGSRSRADELARGAPTPEQVALLSARLHLGDRKLAEVLQLLMSLPMPREPQLRGDWTHWGAQAGLAMINDGKPAEAAPWFERLTRERPDAATGPYGLARVKGEQGDWAGAERLLQQAATLKHAERWPVAYRLGIAQQALGQHDAARASFTRFIEAGKGQKPSIEDARRRLAQLGIKDSDQAGG